MGKTVPSYRMALEDEIAHWKRFREALVGDEDKEAFADIMDMCRSHAAAAQNACKPILFEPMAMSVLLGLQKRIRRLENKIQKLAEQKQNGES
jgi:hypothetical protein